MSAVVIHVGRSLNSFTMSLISLSIAPICFPWDSCSFSREVNRCSKSCVAGNVTTAFAIYKKSAEALRENKKKTVPGLVLVLVYLTVDDCTC